MSRRKLPKSKYGGVIFFEHLINCRLRDEELQKIDNIIKKFKKIYNKQFGGIYINRSHFIRCAIIKQIRQDEGELKWKKKK